ncbi:MAG: LPS export ABC transporter periplasmic protein LptC [Pseudomonadota bacterium]
MTDRYHPPPSYLTPPDPGFDHGYHHGPHDGTNHGADHYGSGLRLGVDTAAPPTQPKRRSRSVNPSTSTVRPNDWYRGRRADRVNPRRSLIIRFLRIAVPSLAAVLLVGTLIWPLINADNESLRQLGQGESAMLNARFEGYDTGNRLVAITADQVTRQQGNQNLIDLQQPLADVTYDDGSQIAIRANQGRFDEDSQQLLLEGDVNLFQPSGFEFTTSRLQVDTSQRAAWTNQPVTGTGPGGTIAGSGVQIYQNGRILVFPGRGRLTFRQLAGDGGAS